MSPKKRKREPCINRRHIQRIPSSSSMHIQQHLLHGEQHTESTLYLSDGLSWQGVKDGVGDAVDLISSHEAATSVEDSKNGDANGKTQNEDEGIEDISLVKSPCFMIGNTYVLDMHLGRSRKRR
jgi:hypothetical protein